METTQEKIQYFSRTLDSHIITFSSDSEKNSNTTSIDTLTKLKTALNNYTMTIQELIDLENGEHKDKRRLSLSCATVISHQADEDIVDYIESNWEKDGKPCLDIYPETEVISLIQGILKVTKDMELVIRKYKWASNKISDNQ